MQPSRTQFYRPVRDRETRRDKRMHHPVFDVRIGGEVWRTANWSLGGLLLIRSYEGSLVPGDRVRGSIAPAGARAAEGVPFTARIVRRARGGHALAVQFDPLDDRLLAFLERCLRRSLRASA
jgi:hypothetical protein